MEGGGGKLFLLSVFLDVCKKYYYHYYGADFDKSLNKGISNILLPCVEAGEADWIYFIKKIVILFWFCQNFLKRHRGKLVSTQKKMLPDQRFQWKLSENYHKYF